MLVALDTEWLPPPLRDLIREEEPVRFAAAVAFLVECWSQICDLPSPSSAPMTLPPPSTPLYTPLLATLDALHHLVDDGAFEEFALRDVVRFIRTCVDIALYASDARAVTQSCTVAIAALEGSGNGLIDVLVLEWPPMYDALYRRTAMAPRDIAPPRRNAEVTAALTNLIIQTRRFFPVGAAAEITAHVAPHLYSADEAAAGEAIAILDIFLPFTDLARPREGIEVEGGAAGPGTGADSPTHVEGPISASSPARLLPYPRDLPPIPWAQWARDWLTLLETRATSLFWTTHVIALFLRLARCDTQGLVDWQADDVSPRLTTFMLQSIRVPVGPSRTLTGAGPSGPQVPRGSHVGQVSESSTPHVQATAGCAALLAHLIGKYPRALEVLHRFVSQLEHFATPGNEGPWTVDILLFCKSFMSVFSGRLAKEAHARTKKHPSPSDMSRNLMVDVPTARACAFQIMRLCERAMFSKSMSLSRTATSIMEHLAHIVPEHVLPLSLRRFATALETTTATHQLPRAIRLLSLTLRPMLFVGVEEGMLASLAGMSNASTSHVGTVPDAAATTDPWWATGKMLSDRPRESALPLIASAIGELLNCIDANDLVKTREAILFLTRLFASLPVLRGSHDDDDDDKDEEMERKTYATTTDPPRSHIRLPISMYAWVESFLSRVFVLLDNLDSNPNRGAASATTGAATAGESGLGTSRRIELSACLLLLLARVHPRLRRRAMAQISTFLLECSLEGGRSDACALASLLGEVDGAAAQALLLRPSLAVVEEDLALDAPPDSPAFERRLAWYLELIASSLTYGVLKDATMYARISDVIKRAGSHASATIHANGLLVLRAVLVDVTRLTTYRAMDPAETIDHESGLELFRTVWLHPSHAHGGGGGGENHDEVAAGTLGLARIGDEEKHHRSSLPQESVPASPSASRPSSQGTAPRPTPPSVEWTGMTTEKQAMAERLLQEFLEAPIARLEAIVAASPTAPEEEPGPKHKHQRKAGSYSDQVRVHLGYVHTCYLAASQILPSVTLTPSEEERIATAHAHAHAHAQAQAHTHTPAQDSARSSTYMTHAGLRMRDVRSGSAAARAELVSSHSMPAATDYGDIPLIPVWKPGCFAIEGRHETMTGILAGSTQRVVEVLVRLLTLPTRGRLDMRALETAVAVTRTLCTGMGGESSYLAFKNLVWESLQTALSEKSSFTFLATHAKAGASSTSSLSSASSPTTSTWYSRSRRHARFLILQGVEVRAMRRAKIHASLGHLTSRTLRAYLSTTTTTTATTIGIPPPPSIGISRSWRALCHVLYEMAQNSYMTVVMMAVQSLAALHKRFPTLEASSFRRAMLALAHASPDPSQDYETTTRLRTDIQYLGGDLDGDGDVLGRTETVAREADPKTEDPETTFTAPADSTEQSASMGALSLAGVSLGAMNAHSPAAAMHALLMLTLPGAMHISLPGMSRGLLELFTLYHVNASTRLSGAISRKRKRNPTSAFTTTTTTSYPELSPPLRRAVRHILTTDLSATAVTHSGPSHWRRKVFALAMILHILPFRDTPDPGEADLNERLGEELVGLAAAPFPPLASLAQSALTLLAHAASQEGEIPAPGIGVGVARALRAALAASETIKNEEKTIADDSTSSLIRSLGLMMVHDRDFVGEEGKAGGANDRRDVVSQGPEQLVARMARGMCGGVDRKWPTQTSDADGLFELPRVAFWESVVTLGDRDGWKVLERALMVVLPPTTSATDVEVTDQENREEVDSLTRAKWCTAAELVAILLVYSPSDYLPTLLPILGRGIREAPLIASGAWIMAVRYAVMRLTRPEGVHVGRLGHVGSNLLPSPTTMSVVPPTVPSAPGTPSTRTRRSASSLLVEAAPSPAPTTPASPSPAKSPNVTRNELMWEDDGLSPRALLKRRPSSARPTGARTVSAVSHGPNPPDENLGHLPGLPGPASGSPVITPITATISTDTHARLSALMEVVLAAPSRNADSVAWRRHVSLIGGVLTEWIETGTRISLPHAHGPRAATTATVTVTMDPCVLPVAAHALDLIEQQMGNAFLRGTLARLGHVVLTMPIWQRMSEEEELSKTETESATGTPGATVGVVDERRALWVRVQALVTGAVRDLEMAATHLAPVMREGVESNLTGDDDRMVTSEGIDLPDGDRSHHIPGFVARATVAASLVAVCAAHGRPRWWPWSTLRPAARYLVALQALPPTHRFQDLATAAAEAGGMMSQLPYCCPEDVGQAIAHVAPHTSSPQKLAARFALEHGYLLWFRHAMLLDEGTRHVVLQRTAHALSDRRPEVAKAARACLAGMLRLLNSREHEQLLRSFLTATQTKIGEKADVLTITALVLGEQMSMTPTGAVLGLSAFVMSCPTETPAWMSTVVSQLARCGERDSRIRPHVKEVLASFLRTHEQEIGVAHLKAQFSEDDWDGFRSMAAPESYFC